MYINQNIAYYRKLCGYTQKALAERLQISQPSYIRYENGSSESFWISDSSWMTVVFG